MALWPFRRRSGRKRSRSGTTSDFEGAPPHVPPEGALGRAASKKKQRTEPAKLQRRPRAYSFSPGRKDSILVDRPRHSSVSPRRDGQHGAKAMDGGKPQWDRAPTLHNKRSSQQPTRRRSSKRKRQDHDREAEVKAMSNFMPVRPAADAWTAGRTIKKDSKRFKTSTPGRPWGSRTSEVSLPLPDSVHSSLSSDSEFASYKVSAFDSLAPRPTLRCQRASRLASSHASVPACSSSPKRPMAAREQIAGDTLKAHKRIDDLADDLDASDLRALMERDNRRRERKRQRDQERAQQRLHQRAEQRKSEEQEARQAGTPPPENLDRGVAGRELVGLGIEPASAVVTSSRRRSRESFGPTTGDEQSSSERPLQTFHRTDTLPKEDSGLPSSGEQHVRTHMPSPPPESTEAVPALPLASPLAGMLRSRKSRSKSTLSSDRDKTATPPHGKAKQEVAQKDMDLRGKTSRFSLTAFFKRGGKGRPESGPSSFSNTSREEMIAAAKALQADSYAQAYARASTLSEKQGAGSGQSPAQIEEERKPLQINLQALAKLQGEDVLQVEPPGAGNYMSRKPSSSVPKRTRSRFREDLPDFPVSPPDSRVQSPEAQPPLPPLTEQVRDASGPRAVPGELYDVAITSPRSADMAQHTPTSMERRYGSPSPELPVSMSLGSIDSEGSWLSGRVGSRRTSARIDGLAQGRALEHIASSSTPTNSTQEDLGIAGDDYLSSLTPDRSLAVHHASRPSGEGRPSSDEENPGEGNMKWGAVDARPQVVHSHRLDRHTFKSYEGFLDMDSGDEGDGESRESDAVIEDAGVQRARSVHVGQGHVRNFSAGSAKLLDITSRGSLDKKGRSQERRRSVPLSTSTDL